MSEEPKPAKILNGNSSSDQNGGTKTLPNLSPATKRKPVPTPRSTLRKPSVDKEEQARRRQIINGGPDSQVRLETSSACQKQKQKRKHLLNFCYLLSQGQTSGESGSPEAESQPRVKTGGEDGEDILAALEKIPGVGSLRSLNSVGSSQPSLTLDPRFRREESSHSLASGFSLGGSDKAATERKRSLGERSRTSPRILMLNGRHNSTKETPSSATMNHNNGDSVASSPASPGSKVLRGAEKRRSLKSVKIDDTVIESSTVETNESGKKAIQERPLPDLPLQL